jgi:hypothetical protein
MAVKKNQLGFLTIVYCAMLVCGLGIFLVHPTGAGLVATLCMTPAVVVSFALPTRRRGVQV